MEMRSPVLVGSLHRDLRRTLLRHGMRTSRINFPGEPLKTRQRVFVRCHRLMRSVRACVRLLWIFAPPRLPIIPLLPPRLAGAGPAVMFLPARARPRRSMQLSRVLQVRRQRKLAAPNLGILPQLIRRWARRLHLGEGRARRLGRAMRLRRTRGELQGTRPRTLSIPRIPWDICQMVDLRARRESSRSLRLLSWEWLF